MSGLERGLLLTSVVLLVQLAPVHPYSHGAPDAACQAISPSHREHTPQTSASPYTLRLSKNSYSAGDNITVTLSSPAGQALIKGFLIQARRADPALDIRQPIGEFVGFNNTHSRLTCSQFQDRGLTHTSGGQMKGSITAVWRAPTSPTGHLIFYYAAVYNFSTFWSKQPGALLTDPTAPPITTQAPRTTGAEATVMLTTSTRPRSTSSSIPAPVWLMGLLSLVQVVTHQ